MDAVVSVPGAEPWSAAGRGERRRLGVILVHGFSANPTTMRALGQQLADEGFAVELPLLPGHGTHYRDLATTRYGDWYDCVERVLDHLRGHVDRVMLVGHSLGGTISIDLATQRARDVDAVAVINPQVLDRTDLPSRLAPVLRYVLPYVPRDLAGLPADDLARADVTERAYRFISTTAAASLLSELPRIRAQLSGLTQPLLVVRSLVDHVVAPENGLALMELADSRTINDVVCERSYHLPQIDHDQVRVAEAVVEFSIDAASGNLTW